MEYLKLYMRMTPPRNFLVFGAAFLGFGLFYYFKGDVGHAFVDGLFALAEVTLYYITIDIQGKE